MKMTDNDYDPTRFVPLPFVQVIDRAVGAERKLTEAELRRCDAALEAHSRMDDLRHGAGDDKVFKANKDLERRLEEMNNFREQINLERAEYLRRDMYDREHANLAERVKNLEIIRGEQAGRTAAYASMVGVVVIIVQIVLHFWKN